MYINTCVCVYGTRRLADQCKQTKPTASRWSDSCLNYLYPSFFGLQILFLPNASLKSGLIRLLMWPTYLLIFVILLYKLYICNSVHIVFSYTFSYSFHTAFLIIDIPRHTSINIIVHFNSCIFPHVVFKIKLILN